MNIKNAPRFAAAIFACGVLAVHAAGFDGMNLVTNDWFDASFTALVEDTAVTQGGALGVTRGAGSWTAVPANGTATVVADADAGGGATCLSLCAPREALTFTPAPFAVTSGMETVSMEFKADALDADLPALDADVQTAFTIFDDGMGAVPVGYVSDGWTNLVYSGAMSDLTNAWFTLTVDFATVAGVRYVRYSVKPAAGVRTILADASGTTWFQAAAHAETLNSVSFSGTCEFRTFGGDSLQAANVASYNGIGYTSVAAAIAAGVADGWANGNVMLLADAAWSPSAAGTYNIDVNGHALTVNDAVYTSSGTTYTVSALNYYWIGGMSGDWSNGSNWSRSSGGVAAGNVPGSSDAAVFTSAATVGLAGNCNVKCIQFDSDVALTGGGALVLNSADAGSASSDAGVVSGTGSIILSNATLRAHVGNVVVTNDIVIANASTNHLTCTSGAGYIHLYGKVLGGGTAYCDQSSSGTNNGGVRFHGDTSQFSGSMYLIATNQRPSNHLADSASLDNAGSTWYIETGAGREGQTFDGSGSNYSAYFPLRVGSATYRFGALSGYIPYAKASSGWLTGVTLKVGYLNADCWLSGNWNSVTASGLEWCATDATMRYAVTNTAFISIDGGTVELAGAGVLRSGGTVTFAGSGATLAFASGVDYDVSGHLSSESTSAVAVDVEDNDLTWNTALTDSNAPAGLIKKGVGTLTLAYAPTYTGATVVEDGELVIPEGATLASLDVADGAHLTIDVANVYVAATTVLTITSTSMTAEKLAAAIRNTETTSFTFTQSGSGFVVSAVRSQRTLAWTGNGADNDWATLENWDNDELPTVVDTVVFPASESTWTVVLSSDATASNIVFNAATEITGGSCKMTVFEVSGTGMVTAKGLKLLSPSNADLKIRAPLEIPEGYAFETETGTQYKHVYLHSKVTGAGEWKMNQSKTNQRGAVQFHGDDGADMSEFAGALTVINKGNATRDQTAIWGSVASSSNAVWTLYGFNKDNDNSSSMLRNSGTTYYFGALNGVVCASGNQSNYNRNTWEIGAREDVDSVLAGNFFCNTYPNLVGDRSDTIRKVGKGSMLTFSGTHVRSYEINAGVLKIGTDGSLLTTWERDGGGSYAPSIAFNGGTLKLSDAVTLDVSTNIAAAVSSSDIVFDDEGLNRRWEVALPGSGGLVKKGAGTLTLSAAPLYTGDTYLDGGTLKIVKSAGVKVKTHVEGKSVHRAIETIDEVEYTVYTIGAKLGTQILFF